jgi:hypothetical protein
VPFPDGNYLFAEPRITARLQERFGPDVPVKGIRSSEDLLSTVYGAPGLFVIYAGDSVEPGHAGRGAASQAVQSWIVSVAVRCAEGVGTGAREREQAGKMFLTALLALQGYEVAPDMPLVRTSCGVPVVYEAGHIYMAAEYTLTVDVAGG